MNTKKSKNKSKSKPIQLQESENIVSENVIQTESVEKLEDIIKEGNKEQDISIDDNHLIDDIPKKPKRTKGRKKNDTFVDEDKKNELFKSPKHQELEETDNNYPEKCIQEVPSVRKKKNKHKKQNTQPIGDEDASSPLVELLDEKDALKEDTIAPSVHIIPTNTETTETKEATKQKKKKKKKIRLDSDKSDKIETQNSCTLAFQKLLQSSDQCNQETSDSETISRAPVDVMDKTTEPTTEAITKTPGLLSDNCEVKPIKELIKDESPKTLDKNKKGKKQPPTKSVKIESIQQPESVIAKDNIVAKDNTNLKEDSPKPRAQIAKPVEKRGKAKRKLQESDNESVSSSLIKADENLKVSDNMQSEKVHPEDNNIIPASIESVNIINKQEKHKEIKKFEELISESSECSLKKRDDEQFEIGLEADNSDFVKVKTGKNKKKKNKDIENHFVADTGRPNLENLTILDNVNVLSEQTKPCTIESGGNDTVTPDYIVAPDFIDYPRSVSQMVVDNNNNTIIQEITTPEEIKLGIPIFTTVPIIQGSGESPEAQNNKLDDKTNVTEIELKTANSPIEKTDIKSKMIEVNRDMEELRRSIERSLAGFTNIENSDSNIEKEFEEIFQSSKQESEAIEIPDVIKEYGSERLNDDANIKDKTSNEKTAKDNSQTTSEIRDESQENVIDVQTIVPVCPARKDKGKGKSKKKSKQDFSRTSSTSVNTVQAATKSQDAKSSQKTNKEEKSTQKTGTSEEKCKKQTEEVNDNTKSDIQDKKKNLNLDLSFEPIENFEDALTSSVDDINKTFELIANDTNEITNTFQYQNNPEINITAPVEDTEQEEKQKEEERRKEKQTPVSQPKNLLGQTDIPVQSNKVDYKKEKNKTPNNIKAKVKIKDSNDIEEKKKDLVKKERREGEVSDDIQKYGAPSNNTNEEFIYKYNFRKVFLQSLCHLCNNDIVHRVPCQFCSIVFYCSAKHKDDDWPQHQPLCFAISTLAHLKDQKHIYADAKNIKGQEYRVLRMQMILSCERILKRKLVPWEQEAMLYPRICADVGCREWKQRKLIDCRACGQISYCSDHPEHLPPTHQRWCKPYSLYKKLVMYHQKFGKLEPRLPTKILECYQMSDNINEVLGSMYEEKIDISDIQYASLTQMASAALTAVYSYQLFTRKLHSPLTNGIAKRSTLTVHFIGSDMQSEADSLNKWEIFFLHLTDIKELRIIFIDPNLNTSNLPLDLLGNIKLCENCRLNKRRVVFNFEDKKNYQEYYSSDEFIDPNIVCIFNSNIQRSSLYSNRDNWPSTVNCILRQKVPFLVTSYTLEELKQDLGHIKRLSKTDFDVISEPKYNPFSSVRPDRNFITDHDMPLLFKNYCFSILCGA